MGDIKRIVLDTETTGVDARKDEILTLSIVDGDANVLWDGLYRPRYAREWPYAERINGISPSDVADCPLITEHVEEIKRIVRSAEEVVIYNAAFDRKFLAAIGADAAPGQKVTDTMLEFSDFYREPNSRHPGQYRWQKLSVAAEHIGYDWGDGHAHSSVDDCLATLAVQKWLDARKPW